MTVREKARWPVPKDLLAHPALAPYRPALGRLPRDRFPETGDLQGLLDDRCRTTTGHPVRFVAAERLPTLGTDAGYEREIGRSGRVSTRHHSLHDLCNALVWATFPRLKATLNQRHLEAPVPQGPGRRGPVRDAITGFDECGALALCPRREPLEILARHDWHALFGASGRRWPGDLTVIVVGHGSIEMLWAPYKAITCRCLLVQSDQDPEDLAGLDRQAAKLWGRGGPINRPAHLCPLPVMGIPGWWTGETAPGFWTDPQVFRSPRAERHVPPIHSDRD